MDFRPIYLYEFKLCQAAAKTSRKINKAFCQRSTNKRTIQRWFQKFRNGDISLQKQEGFHRINVLENEKIKRMVERNPRITVRELAGELGVSIGTVSNYLKELNMKKKIDSIIPHELTSDQCLRRMETCSSLILRNKNDPFLNRIVTCDKKWVVFDNRRRSSQ